MLGGLCSELLGHSELRRFWADFDCGLGGPHRASGTAMKGCDLWSYL